VKVGVLSLCRDRLAYSRHCFAKLHEFAGCQFDHFVLDQGSQDGTLEWLSDQFADGYIDMLVCEPENIGIPRGMNTLLDNLDQDYDVIVKFDNDCELTQPNTLRDICEIIEWENVLLSPCILGLNNPPASTGEFEIMGETIIDIPQIGGIFTAAPARIYDEFRFDGSKLLDDDVQLCWWWRWKGGRCGYVKRLSANHFETTSGQHARYPEYFQRTLAEGKPAL
jgi:hypothetical protein